MNSFRTRDSTADLDDKSHLEGMEERYARLGIVEDITDGEYDDEYDDTYDEGVVNVQEKGDAIDNDLPKNENRFVECPYHSFYVGLLFRLGFLENPVVIIVTVPSPMTMKMMTKADPIK